MAEKLIIIGSGPAAWTAAIYAARAKLDPLVFEGAISEENHRNGTLPLGQLNWTTDVENYPGFPDGILGPDLMLAFRSQASKQGARVETLDVTDVQFAQSPFTLKTSDGKTHETHSIIIATGASAKWLGLPSEERFKNRGVSACAVCDGALPRFRNQPVVVVGGGDTAAEEASYLGKFASKVLLVHRRDTLRASQVMADRVLKSNKVEPLWHSEIKEVLGDDEKGLTGVRVWNNKTHETMDIDATGLFVAIGHRPNTVFLRGQIETDAGGFIHLPKLPHMWTSVPGVFAAGDVADPHYKQAVSAAGMGCKAAIDAERWLAEKDLL